MASQVNEKHFLVSAMIITQDKIRYFFIQPTVGKFEIRDYLIYKNWYTALGQIEKQIISLSNLYFLSLCSPSQIFQ